ncbi:hypothetical protein [Bacillus paralicheniformis]|uniref:hypothetical protein n=1 Tax=Bacillus paralicheniformis TaxID=1648923 RepID=UPI00186B9F98|nr:hypothetical protein [Bacillus paralicheniformis]
MSGVLQLHRRRISANIVNYHVLDFLKTGRRLDKRAESGGMTEKLSAAKESGNLL